MELPPHHHVLPAEATLTRAEAFRVAATHTPEGGTRVAAFVELAVGDDAPLGLEARGAGGAWAPLHETHHGRGARVAILELDRTATAAELRVAEADHARVRSLRWELLTPRYPSAGRVARAGGGPVYALPEALGPLDITTREEWGARPSGCSATEDDWYRMAIHHTAGPQHIGGSVDEVVRGLQAYAQDSGEYCDIPYQMLVGYDGSLWEGRGLVHTSGATGGGNNDGNLAVCFMGCYHPEPACPVSHPVPEVMMERGAALVQALTMLEQIATDADTIRGHRDWPGNSTACPGDFIHARLDELRNPVEPSAPDAAPGGDGGGGSGTDDEIAAGGCGCRVAPRARSPRGAALVVLLAAALVATGRSGSRSRGR